jgi:hypothetical protein
MREMKDQRIITLLPERVAKVGYRYYIIKNKFCEPCKLKKICQDKLVENRIYEVVKKIKRDAHDQLYCILVNETVVPVQIKMAYIKVNLLTRRAKEGVNTRYENIDCNNYNCKFRNECFPIGLRDKDKIMVIKVYGTIPCPLRFQLSASLVLPLL